MRDSATSTVTDRNIRKEQLEKERLGLEAQEVAAKEKKEESEEIEYTNNNIVDMSTGLSSPDRAVADRTVEQLNASPLIKESIIFSNQNEYTQSMIETDRNSFKEGKITSKKDGEELKSPLDYSSYAGKFDDSTPLSVKLSTDGDPLTPEEIKNNSLIEELREKYKDVINSSNQIDFGEFAFEDKVKYFKIDHALAIDSDAKEWYENYKRVEEYYADRWPSGLSPDSEVMFIRRTDSKIPTTVYDRSDTDMHQRQIRNLNNNSTGAIEDQVNPTVKEGELD